MLQYRGPVDIQEAGQPYYSSGGFFNMERSLGCAQVQAGVLHCGLQGKRLRIPAIPQPEGWESFTPAYSAAAHSSPGITQPSDWGISGAAARFPPALRIRNLPVF
jgi:hypothetical protein